MLLHVSTLRSSSGSTFCSLLKLYVKMVNTLLYVSVMRQHMLCMCICCISYREVGRLAIVPVGNCQARTTTSRPTSLPDIQRISCVSKPMSQTFPEYSPPPIKQKSSYQRGSESEQVPRYPVLCRNPRKAVIKKKHATMSNV